MPSTKTEADMRGPITFAQAETYEVGGNRYPTRSTVLELSRKIAEEDRELLDRLKNQ